MPIIASAKKKLRQDIKRTLVNQRIREAMRQAVKLMRQKPTAVHLSQAYKVVDTAAKKRVIHRNQAARLKSRLSKLLSQQVKKSPRKTKE